MRIEIHILSPKAKFHKHIRESRSGIKEHRSHMITDRISKRQHLDVREQLKDESYHHPVHHFYYHVRHLRQLVLYQVSLVALLTAL